MPHPAKSPFSPKRPMVVLSLGIGLLTALPLLGHAQNSAGPAAEPGPVASTAADQTTSWSEGEVLRVDVRAAKVTLRHGPIANLEMPPMTMVFRLTNPEAAATLQPGTKVRFRAAHQQGSYVVTHIETIR